MNDKLLRRTVGVSALIVGFSAIAADCVKNISQGPACDLVTCDTTDSCQGSILELFNDPVTITSSGNPSGKTGSLAVLFTCSKSWTERDAQGLCTVIEDCNLVVNGSQANGFACPRNGGPPA